MKKVLLLTGAMICFLSSAHSCPKPLTPQELAVMKKNNGVIQEQRGRWWKANEGLQNIPLEKVKEINLTLSTGSKCAYEVFSENHNPIGSFILSPHKF